MRERERAGAGGGVFFHQKLGESSEKNPIFDSNLPDSSHHLQSTYIIVLIQINCYIFDILRLFNGKFKFFLPSFKADQFLIFTCKFL